MENTSWAVSFSQGLPAQNSGRAFLAASLTEEAGLFLGMRSMTAALRFPLKAEA